MPGERYAFSPIRGSVFIPRATSAISAPDFSQMSESSLVKAMELARKALIPCFTISALVKFMVRTWAGTALKSERIFFSVFLSSVPRMTRPGER